MKKFFENILGKSNLYDKKDIPYAAVWALFFY